MKRFTLFRHRGFRIITGLLLLNVIITLSIISIAQIIPPTYHCLQYRMLTANTSTPTNDSPIREVSDIIGRQQNHFVSRLIPHIANYGESPSHEVSPNNRYAAEI